jgi:hypothetical protein
MLTKHKRILKSTFIECSLNSTSHSIPKLFRTENILVKIMWTILTFISVGSCAYLIVRSFNDYLEYNVTTQIRVIDELTSPFPTITICNKDPFVTEFARQVLNTYSVDGKNFEQLLNEYVLGENSYTLEYQTFLALVYNEFSEENKTKLGHSLEKSFLDCQFKFDGCNINNSRAYYDSVYGNCIKFNSGLSYYGEKVPILNISSAGYLFGLKFTMFVGNQFNKKPMNVHIPAKGYFYFIFNLSIIILYK